MEVKLTEDQTDLIRGIAKEEGFTEYELETKSGSIKGDNYLGVITTVCIKNNHKQLELILKSAMDNEELRKRIPIRKVFLREMYLYETIFPQFKKFETEHGFLEGFSGHARLYGCSNKEPSEMLVLENLKAIGYEMWNRKIPMTEAHIELVFKEYAKFHAISFAMRETNPELYQQLSTGLNNVFGEMGTPEENSVMLKITLENGLKAVESDKFATEALARFAPIAEEFLLNCMKETDENSVILHGDCWCNNMLFKYENGKIKPTHVCLIDWQVAWTGSPVLDLAYFLFTCSSKEILTDYDRYLKIYHATLCNSLKHLDCDPETIYPLSSLESSWQKYAKFGMYLSMMLLRLMLSDGSEIPDISELADSGKNFADGFNFHMSHGDTYNKRILDIVTVSAEKGWI